jgi:hypothetical protein
MTVVALASPTVIEVQQAAASAPLIVPHRGLSVTQVSDLPTKTSLIITFLFTHANTKGGAFHSVSD